MRLDWEIAKRGWRRYSVYPWATAAGVFTNTIFGFLQAYVLLAVYRHRTDVGGFDSADAVTYVWLAQSMIMTVYVFGWWDFALRIRDGSIATDLLRPLDPQRYWLAFDLGRAPYHFLFRGLPPFVLGALVFELHYPSPLDALAFLVSLTLAVVVSFGFRFIYNSAAFWLLDYRGVVRAEVTTALALDAGRADAIRHGLATLTGREVRLTTKIDPSIIGGMVARIGSTVYDASVTRQLEKMKERLTEGARG